MASCSSLLSEEQFLCPICLEVFVDPVTTQCGHNFCKACISNYWDTADLCECPLCKNRFYRRPMLHVNTTFRDVVENFKGMKVRDEEGSTAKPGEVSCDVCTGRGHKALKSCLWCLTSYCETHLEPHLRVSALKKHKLVPPVENLEDRTCKKHDKLLELFCRKDQMTVCLMCMNTDHKTHNAVPLEQEFGQRKATLRKMKADIDQKMKTRSMKVQQIKHSVETSKRDAEREISDSLEVCTALVSSIERSHTELIQVIVEKQKAAEKQAEGFIKELEQEITELKRRSSELEQLSHSEDHLHLLRSFPSLSTPPHTKDWSQVSVQRDLSVVGTARRAVSQLEDTLNREMEKWSEVKLKMIQQYAVDVTLDPDTAHRALILSEDGKQVSGGHVWKDLPDIPERFGCYLMALGKQSFSSGRFYYEVQVEGKSGWGLGVVRESINRKGLIIQNPENGYWTIQLKNGHEYRALAGPDVLLSLREQPQKVGVFVDYEKGQVSFYNVEAKSHICSYTGCTFTEKLLPFFSPSSGTNSAPLIITPVSL